MPKNKAIKPGTVAKTSGQAVKAGSKSKLEITLVKGKIVPPMGKGKQAIRLVDKTKHKT